MGSSSSKNEISGDGTKKKNIKNIKRIPPDADSVRPEKEDRNTKKLREINEKDDYDTNKPEYHEYMFFSMKNGEEKKNNNLELLKKSIKKKKQLYTFTKEDDRRKDNELAQILHIEYDLKKPKYTYSIKQMKCDPPPVNNDYLVIEYNLNSLPDNEVESEEIEDEESEEEEDSHNKDKKNKKRYKITSRVVHTNSKNCKISNYVYTQHNGERYDYLDMNKDPNQVRQLKLNKNEDKDKDEEKRVNEKEENQDRFIIKQKKKKFTCKKMF